MERYIIGLFTNSKKAGEAVADLKNHEDVIDLSVVAKDEDQDYVDTSVYQIKEQTGDNLAEGAVGGGILGALFALLVGLPAVTIPGGIIVSGALATALLGATAGATLGAFTAMLMNMGVPEDQVKILTNRIEQGDVVVIAKSNSDNDHIENVMKNHDALLIEEYE